jgi:hypothetical protein
MRSRRAASFQSASGIWSSSSFHAKVVFLPLYKLRKNLEKLYSLKQNIPAGGRREVMWNQECNGVFRRQNAARVLY